MAKEPAKPPTTREVADAEGNIVDQFMQVSTQLLHEAASYAASGQEDPETSANIRQIKVMTAALMAALQTIR